MSAKWVLPAVLFCAAPAVAGDPPDRAAETQALTVLLHDLLLKNLPDPIVETNHDWGRQKDVVVGMAWHKLKAEPRRADRNDGHWEKLRVQGVDPPNSLSLGIKNLTSPEPGRTTFDAVVALDVRLTYEQQVWKAGTRFYSGETRARCRAVVRLACELTNRTELRPGSILPDVVVRVRVTDAELAYHDLVCEHTAGVGGDAAKAIGEAVRTVLKKLKPDLERDLLARANGAIVKAADTKEVRVEFDKLLAGKAPAVTRTKP
jgi:hypothetical protein